MATPPPLPRRGPPPLPRRGGPPPLPTNRGAEFRMPGMPSRPSQPPPLPGTRTGMAPADSTFVSLRDVTRARGNVFGRWILFNSQALEKAKFDYDWDLNSGERLNTGTITIQYINLDVYEFYDRSPAEFMDLIESSSKGRYNYYHIRGPGPPIKGKSLWTPYRKVSSGPRGKAATLIVKRKQVARAPIGKYQAERTYKVGGKRKTRRKAKARPV